MVNLKFKILTKKLKLELLPLLLSPEFSWSI